MCVFVNFFFKKILLRNYCLNFYQISKECSLDKDKKKLLFTITEKSGMWSDKGAQVPLLYIKVFLSPKIFVSGDFQLFNVENKTYEVKVFSFIVRFQVINDIKNFVI